MAAVLRASGPDFDVDAFVATCGWNVDTVFRRGEARRPLKPDGPKHESSGFNAAVSVAGAEDFAGQIKDAILFLTQEKMKVRSLVKLVGSENVILDFAVAWRDVAAQFDRFSADLVRAAGKCGVALELSHYTVSEGKGGGH